MTATLYAQQAKLVSNLYAALAMLEITQFQLSARRHDRHLLHGNRHRPLRGGLRLCLGLRQDL